MERLNVYDAMEQAIKDAQADELPAVFWRKLSRMRRKSDSRKRLCRLPSVRVVNMQLKGGEIHESVY